MKKVKSGLILGISAWFHDSAAALIDSEGILAAAQEERFSRIKQDASFPLDSIRFCLHHQNLKLSDLEAVVFFEKPFQKFERLLTQSLKNCPHGLRRFITSMPVWIKKKLFARREIRQQLLSLNLGEPPPIQFSEHHFSHAASAFYPSGLEEAAILVVDGVGEKTTISLSRGKGAQITELARQTYPHSAGFLYSAFTQFLGFRVNQDEYKVMGLAPYASADHPEVQKYEHILKNRIITLLKDGSIHLNKSCFAFETQESMIRTKVFEELFDVPARRAHEPLSHQHTWLARACQNVLEQILIRLANTAGQMAQSSNLVMAGGVALNCVANSSVRRETQFEKFYVQPAASDSGAALGAALAYRYSQPGITRNPRHYDMRSAALGPAIEPAELEALKLEYGAVYTSFPDSGELDLQIAQLLQKGQIIGWVQGRMEFGPRALGQRSILADARDPGMQKRLNLKTKFREGFRPFAPAVLAHRAADVFDTDGDSPYMLFTYPVRPQFQWPTLEESEPILKRLYRPRSPWPAITHIDYSARLQTVDSRRHPRFFELLEQFEDLTGCPLLINTSFNRRDEPIVCTARDAYRAFMAMDMDALVIQNCLFFKHSQTDYRAAFLPEANDHPSE